MFVFIFRRASQTGNDSGKKENKQTTSKTSFIISIARGIDGGVVQRFIRKQQQAIAAMVAINNYSNDNKQQTCIYCTVVFIKTTNDHEMPYKENT